MWPLVLKICNVICSALTVAFGTYAASESVEGAVVAGMGAAVQHLRDNPIGVQSAPALAGVGQNLKLFGFLLILTFGFPIMGHAATTLTWNRNTESDMSFYTVYACAGKGCLVSKTSVKSSPIPQPAVGAIPSWPLPSGEGTVAVSATDTAGNESELSLPLSFDRVAPTAPSGVTVK